MRRLTGLLLAALAAGPIVTQAGPVALGDLDPASDVLLQQDVYVPYQPAVCSQLKGALETAAKRASAAGYPVKVAVIGSDVDLGGAPQFFGHPSSYADFLGRELASFSPHLKRKLSGVPLLVAMPQGLALWNGNARLNDAIKHIAIPSKADSNALARAAAEAVAKMATASGHPIAAVKIPSGCTHNSSSISTILPFGVPILLLVLVGLALRFRRPDRHANP